MRNFNYLKIFPLVIFILLLFTGKTLAVESISRVDMKIDEQLTNESNTTYTQPKKIYISQITGFDEKLANDSEKWVKLLYYYSVTKLNLQDIPYNYVIDENGKIFEGKSGGIGANPGLINGENIVMVGYLSSKNTLTPLASSSFANLVEDLSYMYAVKEGNFGIVNLLLSKKEGGISLTSLEEVSEGTFVSSVSQSLEGVKWSEKENLNYKASIESVEYSKDVVVGENLTVTVKVKNGNDFTWFGDSEYIHISTKDSVDSPFAINSVWDSFSKPTHMSKAFLKAGDTTEISFDLLAKSKPGAYTSEFSIVKSPDSFFEDSDFTVDFNIGAGDNKLVEVYSPEYGFVNIRECRWFTCEKVEVADEGDVFIVTNTDSGWYEIEYEKGKKGWVYTRYVKEL